MDIRKILNFVLFFVLFSLLNFQFLEYHWVSKLIILWLSILLISGQVDFSLILEKKNVLYLWVLPLLLTVFYSEDLSYALKRALNLLPLIFLPLLMKLTDPIVKNKIINITKILFPVSAIVFGLYVIIRICWFFYDPFVVQYGKPNIFSYLKFVYEHRFGYLVNKDDIEVFSQEFHKAYYSISLLISLLFVSQWKDTWLRRMTFVVISLLILLFKSFPHIILLMIILQCLLFWKSKRKLALSFSISFFLGIGSLLTPKVQFYLKDLMGYRNSVYQCSFDLMSSKPFFGYGLGDVKGVLEGCYSKINCLDCAGLNSHNQYVEFFLSGGLLVVIPFLLFLFVVIKNNKGNLLQLMFLVIFIVSFLFENIFSRMWGVFMFSFFFSLIKENPHYKFAQT